MKTLSVGGSDEEVIRATVDAIGTLVKDSIVERIFTLLPDLQKLQSVHDRHLGLYNEVLGGKREKEGELQAVRQEVSTQLGLLRGMALLAGTLDPTIPQKLGLQQQHPVVRRTASNLVAPDNFRMTYNGRIIVVRANAVKGAKSYEVWGCDGDPMTESNWRHLITSGRGNHIEIPGLAPGTLYYFRIRAISSTGSGPWSNFKSMMAI